MTDPISGHTILVTGAAGFIGSHTVERLLARGAKVVGVDNFDPYYSRTLKDRNVNDIRSCGGSFEFIEGDICDHNLMRTVFTRTKPGGVIHLAAKAGVRPSIEDPVGYANANVTGTAVMLDCAHRAGCDRIVVASSSSVYGNSHAVPFCETQDVNAPISPYAASKRSCEIIAHAHHHLTNMPTALLRFFTVFGPRQRPDLAIDKFLRRVAAGESIEMFGDGSSSRDYTYVDDIVTGVLASYERIPEFGYRIWNLGGSHPTTLNEMIDTIARVVGRPANIVTKPMQPGDVDRTWADLSRSGVELNFKPATDFETGVRRQWIWISKGG